MLTIERRHFISDKPDISFAACYWKFWSEQNSSKL